LHRPNTGIQEERVETTKAGFDLASYRLGIRHSPRIRADSKRSFRERLLSGRDPIGVLPRHDDCVAPIMQRLSRRESNSGGAPGNESDGSG
jgi:hypothetical protein